MVTIFKVQCPVCGRLSNYYSLTGKHPETWTCVSHWMTDMVWEAAVKRAKEERNG